MSELTDVLGAIESLSARGEKLALATIVAVRGSTYRRPGARSVIGEDGSVAGAISGGCVERDIALRAKAWVADFAPRKVTYDSSSSEDIVFGLGLGCRGKIDMLVQPFDAEHPPRLPPVPGHEAVSWTTTFEGRVVLEERVEPQRSLAIFGRGPDTEPVAAVANAIGWEAEIIRSWDQPRLGGFHAVVIMTHNFLHDVALVHAAFESQAQYIGLLGPKSRGAEILTQIGDVTPEMRSRLHSPIGLDLGGDSPEAIALSIVSEIQSVFHAASGDPLREKDGPIHDTVMVSDLTR